MHVVEHEGHSQLGLLSLDFTFVFMKSAKVTWKDFQWKKLEVTKFLSLFFKVANSYRAMLQKLPGPGRRAHVL